MSIMNNEFATTRRNLGFSMIDVLVAIIVLATGLLALAALQAALTRNSADARARAQVGAYADGLIDQLRASGYDNIAAGTISASSGTTAQKSAATAIQNATGVGGLSTAITVDRYYGSGSTFTKTVPSSVDGTTPEYKEVNVTSSWTDSQGQPRSLKLSTIISPTSISMGNGLASGTPLSTSATMTPVVHQFRPDYTAGVIPIAVNPSDSTAATNPKPEILGTKTQTLAGVSYNVLTYTDPSTINGNANQVTVQQQVDTRVIGCHCKYGQGITDTTNVFAQPYRPTYWNGTQYSTPVKTTWAFTNLGADPAYSSTQDEFCDVCCRDRNDTQGDKTVDTTTGQDGVLFNPWNTDYDHWGYSGNTLVSVATAPSSNGSTAFGTSTASYVNACRLIRVNGQYSAATDLQSYFFGFIATDTASNAKVPTDSTSTNVASSPTPTSTATTNYSNFVLAYLKENLGGSITASGFPYDTPSNGYPTAQKANNGGLTNAAQLWSNNGLNSPANINITYSTTTDYRYLHARGFYIDHLEPAAVTAINKAITNCSGTVSDCVLQMIPFTTINLTELAAWTTDTNGSKVVTVSDNAITGVGTNGAPLRGAVNALATASNNASGNAVANMGLSNSAVTGILSNAPINTEDANTTVSALQQFTLTTGGSSSGGLVYFQFVMSGLPQIATYGSTSSPTVTWAGTSSLGTLSTGTTTPCQTGSAGSYSIIYASSCSNKGVVTANLSATPIASAPVGLNVSVKSYNAQILGSATTGGGVVGCTSEVQTQCKVYKVSGITLGSNTLSASSLAISTTDSSGINVSSIVTVPASMTAPAFTGFSSTSSTAPDQLVITFAQDTVNSYSVAGTCGACNSSGKKCTYTPGTCTQ